MQESDGTGGTHDGDLGGGPCEVEVGTQALGTHHAVCPAVGFAHGDGDLRDGGFAVGVQKLGTTAEDAVVLLAGSGEEAGDVDKHHNRDVEGVAGADEAGGLF